MDTKKEHDKGHQKWATAKHALILRVWPDPDSGRLWTCGPVEGCNQNLKQAMDDMTRSDYSSLVSTVNRSGFRKHPAEYIGAQLRCGHSCHYVNTLDLFAASIMASAESMSSIQIRREKNRLAQQRHRTRAKELRANQQQPIERQEVAPTTSSTTISQLAYPQTGTHTTGVDPVNIESPGVNQIARGTWNASNPLPSPLHGNDHATAVASANSHTQSLGTPMPSAMASAVYPLDISDPFLQLSDPVLSYQSMASSDQWNLGNASSDHLMRHDSLEDLGTHEETRSHGGDRSHSWTNEDQNWHGQAVDEYGLTPLHVAARRGNNAAVTALLDQGVDVDTRDRHGWTPLHHASWCQYDETVTLLIQKGALLDAATIPEHA
ncbi:MAG: hypothetical protein Q9159_004841 [Coniocarpon cinnabarinum]